MEDPMTNLLWIRALQLACGASLNAFMLELATWPPCYRARARA